MPIAGGILVAGTAAHCLSSAAGMLRFLARLSGRRRHARRSSGPGGGARAVEGTEKQEATRVVVGGLLADCREDDGRGVAVVGGGEGGGGGECESRTVGTSMIEEVSCSPVADGEVCRGDSGTTTDYDHRRRCHRPRQQEQRRTCRGCLRRRNSLAGNELVVDGEADDEATRREQPAASPRRDIERDIPRPQRYSRYLRQRRHHHHPHHHHHHREQSEPDRLRHPHHRHRHLRPRLQDDRPPCDRNDLVDPIVRTSKDHADGSIAVSDYDHDINNPVTVTAMTRGCRIPPYLATLLILSYTLFGIADACSSRSTPKPRPPTPTPRPNITFHMYTCPPDYAEWYCLNGATCFTVKIVESLLYNCLCANGYIGQRCEFKDLDGSYLPSRQRVMLETASIAGGATIAVFLVVIICIAAYIHCKRKQKELRSSNCVDTVDGPGRDPELRPFSNRSRSLMIFMSKNPNSSATIEQTRMPGWNSPETETMRMASVNEGKRSSQ